MSLSSDLPYPPFELATRVHELPADDLNGYIAYETAGADTRAELVALLPEPSSLRGKRILDFGCGAGRTLRHFLAEAESGEVWGADIDRRSIQWLQENLSPPLRVVCSDVDPPLPFDSGSFDFIWAISVFTHLSTNSAKWLLELHRILKPDGFLMASYMGEWNSEHLASEEWDPDRIGMNVLEHNRPWALGGPMVLMSDWWVREHWGRAFDFECVNPWVYNQTWPLLRRKDVSITPEDLLAPSDDPRECIALRHNVTQLQREIDALSALAEGTGPARKRLREDYEKSYSWRLTRPLRGLSSRIRQGR